MHYPQRLTWSDWATDHLELIIRGNYEEKENIWQRVSRRSQEHGQRGPPRNYSLRGFPQSGVSHPPLGQPWGKDDSLRKWRSGATVHWLKVWHLKGPGRWRKSRNVKRVMRPAMHLGRRELKKSLRRENVSWRRGWAVLPSHKEQPSRRQPLWVTP